MNYIPPPKKKKKKRKKKKKKPVQHIISLMTFPVSAARDHYRQASNIRHIKSQHLKDSPTVLRLSPGGGYSLCDGWYICAAVLTPFFHFGRIEHDLFGVFFSSTNSKAIFWGTKTTNFYKNRSFWPQIQFFPRSFWVQFSAASGTPPSVFRPSTPPRGLSLPNPLKPDV